MTSATNSQRKGDPRGALIVIILLSVLPLFVTAWFLGGLNAIGFSAMDSQGRTMGFNDPLSMEHYGMIWRAGSVERASGCFSWYEWGLLGVQAGVAAAVLCGHWQSRWFKGLLWVQPVIFFWGLIGLYALPLLIMDWMGLLRVVGGPASDREGFTDVPLLEIIGQGAWLWACALMAWRIWRAGKEKGQPLLMSAAWSASETH